MPCGMHIKPQARWRSAARRALGCTWYSYHHLTLCSQVLVLLSDTGKRGQTLLSVPKHSQTSQDAVKTPPRGPQDAQEAQEAPKIAPRPPR